MCVHEAFLFSRKQTIYSQQKENLLAFCICERLKTPEYSIYKAVRCSNTKVEIIGTVVRAVTTSSSRGVKVLSVNVWFYAHMWAKFLHVSSNSGMASCPVMGRQTYAPQNTQNCL